MNTLGNLSKLEQTPKAIFAHYDSGEARIEVFKSGIVHLTVMRGKDEMKSFAVIDSPVDIPASSMKIGKADVELAGPGGTFNFHLENLEFSFIPKSGVNSLDLKGVQFSDTGLVAEFDIHGARNFYGLGEKTLPFNKYGTRATMWNSDFPAYTVRFDPLYESIPFLLKSDPQGTYGIFLDNTSRTTFDVCATDSDQIVYTAKEGAFELYVIPGKNPAEVVGKFSELTGKMHMPPLWALGYQQSRWSYYPEARVLELARGFRENKIPCDVIYLDIDYMNGYKCFTWSPKNFPTPKEMLDTLHGLGFKVVTIIDPGIKDEKGYDVFESGMKDSVFVKKPDGSHFTGQVWPGKCVFPDFFNEKTRKWWGSQYKFLLDYGVDGFWNDMNEPSVFDSPNKTFDLDVVHLVDEGQSVENEEQISESKTQMEKFARHVAVHNAYGMQMARATREGLERLEPNLRPLVLTRANYAGGQRYAAMWTGDNFASFAHLRLALSMFLNIGLSGQPFVGSDVGGFIGDPSPELFSRWLELGVFSPFFRTHSVINSKPREPWAFGEPYTGINRNIIDRRYELIPELYSEFKNAHDTGLPMVRPLFLNYPEDQKSYELSDEFLFGDKFLVAPVLDSGKVKRNVYLPSGNWMSFYDGKLISEGWHEFDAPLGMTPIFVKDGGVVFTQSLVQSTSDQADTLILKVFSMKRGKGSAYFDDGVTRDYRDGKYLAMDVTFGAEDKTDVLDFGLKGDYVPGYKFIAVEIPFTERIPYHDGVLETVSGNQTFAPVRDERNGFMRVTFPFSPKIKRIVLK